jgi:hypothetical protein
LLLPWCQSGTARAAVEVARLEAERRGDRRIGSEHLLIALLQDDGLDAIAASTPTRPATPRTASTAAHSPRSGSRSASSAPRPPA